MILIYFNKAFKSSNISCHIVLARDNNNLSKDVNIEETNSLHNICSPGGLGNQHRRRSPSPAHIRPIAAEYLCSGLHGMPIVNKTKEGQGWKTGQFQ